MRNIEINESFESELIKIEVGDTLTIKLPESPTTGYVWEVTELNEKEIDLVGQLYQISESSGIGGGGIKTFNLKVLKKATGRLRFENRRRWEAEAYKTFTLHYE